MKQMVLVVEDDRDINELLKYNLEKEGYAVQQAFNGGEGLEKATSVRKRPDLILLDLMLPLVDGLDICRILKQDEKTKHIPIIILTAKGEESDVVLGLSMGADDYVPKPFSLKVLLARIKAMFRRIDQEKNGVTGTRGERSCGGLSLDTSKRRVTYKNKVVDLTTLEFDILELLSRSPGRVFTRDEILDNVWKEGKFIIDRAVDVHIRGLRKALGKAEHLIETVRGAGYRFKDLEDL